MNHRGQLRAGLASALSVTAALALAAPIATAAGSVPLGDGDVSGTPQRGGLFLCGNAASGRGGKLPWIKHGRWAPEKKPMVDGAVSWPGPSFTLAPGPLSLDLSVHGRPGGPATGLFPAAAGDDARGQPAASRSIVEQRLVGALPDRRGAGKARCVADGPLGIAADGVPIYPPGDASGLDLGAREVRDRCGGTVLPGGQYAYLTRPLCLGGESRRHSPLIGRARDGISIFGPRGPGGRRVRTADLDKCHGHLHRVGGVRRYHYHATDSFPYMVGCLRARPAAIGATPLPRSGPTSVGTDPGLFPEFDPGIHDYVVRCPDGHVDLELDLPDGSVASVDGGPDNGRRLAGRVTLGEGRAFSFELRGGDVADTYHVRCLPADFPNWTYERTGTPREPFYLITPSIGSGGSPYVTMFDRNGVPVWFIRSDYPPVDGKVLSDGTIAFARNLTGGFGAHPDSAYEIRELDGDLLRTITTVGSVTDHHDLIEVGNGNVILLTYAPRDGVDLSEYGGPASATVVDSQIQEIDPDGDLVWSWSTADHVDLDETGRWWVTVVNNPTTLPPPDGRTVYDATHVNSAELVGDSVIASFRHLDAVLKIDRSTGDIEWKLGGTTTPESLTVLGDPESPDTLGGQHDARILEDGTLSIHDNGTNLGRPPRAVRYELDEGLGTATLVESVEDPLVPFSFCCGSSRRAADGSWLMAWGGNPFVTEFDPAGDRTFRIGFGGAFTYRAFPVHEGVLSAAQLRQAMESLYPR